MIYKNGWASEQLSVYTYFIQFLQNYVHVQSAFWFMSIVCCNIINYI